MMSTRSRNAASISTLFQGSARAFTDSAKSSNDFRGVSREPLGPVTSGFSCGLPPHCTVWIVSGRNHSTMPPFLRASGRARTPLAIAENVAPAG